MRFDDLPAGIGDLTYGRIASVDLKAGRIIVDLGDVQTQPVRWFTGGSGKTRVWSRPQIGEQVILLAPGGDIAGAVALRGLDCDAFPPIADEAREIVDFGDGAILSYDPNAHILAVVLPAGATVSIVAPGGITLDCDVRVTGDMVVDGKVEAGGDVKSGAVSLLKHKHLGVQPGGGVSQGPQQ